MSAEPETGNHTKRPEPPPRDTAAKERRCRRCGQVLDSPERETYFERTGMCFWCAYVDSQG